MLSIEGISKRYGKDSVLEEISLKACSGEVYGLVGHNGAGKTTLLKIVAGVYLSDAGAVRFGQNATLQELGPENRPYIVADEPYFVPQATPAKMRAFLQGYYPRWSDSIFDALSEIFDLNRDEKIAEFSKGMQRQVALLLGFATRTPYLLLDESFDGLDVSKRDLLKRLLRIYAQENKAVVLLSSHNMEELQNVSDRIGVIDEQRLVMEKLSSEFASGELQRLFFDGTEVSDDELRQIFAQ